MTIDQPTELDRAQAYDQAIVTLVQGPREVKDQVRRRWLRWGYHLATCTPMHVGR